MSDDLGKRVLKWVGSNHNQTEAIELMEAQATRIAELEAKLNLLMGPPPDKVSLRAGMIAAGVSQKTADEILRSPAFNRAALEGGEA